MQLDLSQVYCRNMLSHDVDGLYPRSTCYAYIPTAGVYHVLIGVGEVDPVHLVSCSTFALGFTPQDLGASHPILMGRSVLGVVFSHVICRWRSFLIGLLLWRHRLFLSRTPIQSHSCHGRTVGYIAIPRFNNGTLVGWSTTVTCRGRHDCYQWRVIYDVRQPSRYW